MEAKHVWNGLPLENCSNAELAEAQAYAEDAIASVKGVRANSGFLTTKREARLDNKQAHLEAYLGAVNAELGGRK
mgnify:CR=1 FL=1